MDIQTIKQAFKDNNVTITKDDYWKVQSNYVIYHKAIERLGAAIKIKWDEVTLLRCEKDEAVILVKATRPDNGMQEWSIGEAVLGVNYRVSGKQAAYVFAMAEKRAKDRVILKLAGLHGVYSDEEAKENFGRSNATNGDEIYDEAPEVEEEASQGGGEQGGNVVSLQRRAAQAAQSQPKGEPVPSDPETGEVLKPLDLDAEMSAADRFKATINGFSAPKQLQDYMMKADTRADINRLGKEMAEQVTVYARERLVALRAAAKAAIEAETATAH